MSVKEEFEQLPFKQKLFFLFEILGLISALSAYLSSLANSLPTVAVWASFACLIVMVLNLLYAIIFRNIKIAGMLCCVSINFIMFPVLFFSSGGVRSGMLYFFILGATVSALILTGKKRIFMLVATIIEDCICLHYGFTHVEELSILTESQQTTDVISSYVIVALFMSIVVIILMRQYDKEHERLLNYNHDLKQRSVTDEMTHLYNHRYAEKKLKEFCKKAVDEQKPFSILLLDIDYFKKVNDTYGHLRGNSVLARFAEIITREAQEGPIVTRYGGEEFLILLYGYTAAQTGELAENLRCAVANDMVLRNLIDDGITVSGGIAEYREGQNAESILSEADENLYKAKAAGRNRIIASN